MHPDDKELLHENWEKYSSRGKSSQANYRFIKPDGTIVWVLGNAVPEIVDGKIIGYVGTITDITKIKLAEKELRESEEKYRTIIDGFPDIIMISDLEKNIVFANEALEKHTGIAPEDYNNPSREPHIHPDDVDFVQDAIKDLFISNKKHTDLIENRFIDKWGTERWFSGIVSKLEINNQMMLQTISRDITSRKQAEKELDEYRNNLEILVKQRTEELATTNEELQSINEELMRQREELEFAIANLKTTQGQLVQSEKMASLGLLSSGIAHEINNPLNFIKAGLYGLKSYINTNFPDHVEQIASLIKTVNSGVDRAANIVSSLNHYSRQNDVIATKCDIHSIIENCLVMLHNQTKNRVEVAKEFTSEAYVLMGNDGRLHQAILNILSNAAQAIPEKGDIKITTCLINKYMCIVITDSGSGINPQDFDKIFDPFFTTKEVGKGTGLGLSITQTIIAEHNGTVSIKSEPGKGTEVEIKLPLAS